MLGTCLNSRVCTSPGTFGSERETIESCALNVSSKKRVYHTILCRFFLS